jgi:tRNA1(Val) A37 N6-methylase TrmN6
MSEDRLLDGRVVLRQPDAGYRAAIDPVFLAAAVPAKSGERVLDAGCGVGAGALCLASRVAGVQVVGIDAQSDLISLAAEGARLSGLSDRSWFIAGDILSPPGLGAPFDHVMANPPYLAEGSAIPPPDPAKRQANVEGEAKLADWVAFCLGQVKAGGSVTFIHRADRQGEVIAALEKGAGGINVFPLWPKSAGEGAKRVIVQGVKGGANGVSMCDGLVLHQENGDFTPAAQAVLRAAQTLTL